MAGAGAAVSSSLSSSASLSEPDEEEEDEEDEDEEEEEFLDCFFDCAFGASFISTSESLDSSELLELSSLLLELLELSDELDSEDFSVVFSLSAQFWKISSKDGAFLESDSDLLTDLLACSFAKALPVLVKPDSVRKASMEAISWGGKEGALLAFRSRKLSVNQSFLND